MHPVFTQQILDRGSTYPTAHSCKEMYRVYAISRANGAAIYGWLPSTPTECSARIRIQTMQARYRLNWHKTQQQRPGLLHSSECILSWWAVLIQIHFWRHCIKHMHSDHGTNFMAAATEVREAAESWQDHQVVEYLSMNTIEWHNITPSTSHHGGARESMVKIVRTENFPAKSISESASE